MNRIKQEKGVTLVILTVIIIALMILVGVSINLGTYDVNSTLDSKLEGELKMVQYAVFQQYAKYKTTLNENYIVGSDYSKEIKKFMSDNYPEESLVHNIVSDEDSKYKKYYLLTPDDLIEIGVQDSEYSYIVNYYTGEVMNADKFETSNGTKLYVKGLDSTRSSESF